jgi:hypothetical protein
MDFKRDWWRFVLTLFVIWLVFLMDLEGRSFAQHVVRIATTPETKELGYAIGEKFGRMFDDVRRRADLGRSRY